MHYGKIKLILTLYTIKIWIFKSYSTKIKFGLRNLERFEHYKARAETTEALLVGWFGLELCNILSSCYFSLFLYPSLFEGALVTEGKQWFSPEKLFNALCLRTWWEILTRKEHETDTSKIFCKRQEYATALNIILAHLCANFQASEIHGLLSPC